MQTGFGPFLAVYLTTEKLTNADIGFVLTIGTVIALIGQVPAGALVDAARRERLLAGGAMAAIGASALCIALWPHYPGVFLAQVLHAGASVIIGPALAAISLGLVGHAAIGERLGRNARFASSGSVIAAAIMGATGYYLSSRSVFYVTALMAVPALIALRLVSADDVQHDACDKDRASAQGYGQTGRLFGALAALWRQRPLVILATAVGLFHLSNAAILPLVANEITQRASDNATALVALCIIVPQVLVACLSPWVGRYADARGRKPLLIMGFGALPLRAALMASTNDPTVMVALQILDGISAAGLGVLISGSVADITRQSGHFNLALGCVGVAMGVGAATSTTLAGVVADSFGPATALFGLSVVGLLAFLVMTLKMPETRSTHLAAAAATRR